MSLSRHSPCVIVSLDVASADAALAIADRLDPALCRFKVGKELFVVAGPSLLEKLQQRGYRIFLDLKFHDIPNTVARACAAAASLGVWMMTVHASGGRAMLQAAKEALMDRFSHGGDLPLLVAVTVLTSLNTTDLEELGYSGRLAQQVARLATLAFDCGLDGIVCSAHEAAVIRGVYGKDFCLVTPGIRLRNADQDDQKRIMTPVQAIKAGSDYLVIGRPIITAPDPLAVLQAITEELKSC